MPRPICRKCAVEMGCTQNEVVVNDPAKGPFGSTYWRGDAFSCPTCKAEVVVGFGKSFSSPGSEESEEFRYA